MNSRLNRIWSKFWMRYSGLGLFGRIATRLADWYVPPYYERYYLANFNSKGYVSSRATVYHDSLYRSKRVFIDDDVLLFQDKDGAEVELKESVHIHRYTIIQTGQNGSVSIGKLSSVQASCYFSAYIGSIVLGENVQIASNCCFYSYNHGIKKGQSISEQPIQSKGGITIGDDAWLGTGVTVLDGVNIGRGAAIAAGSVVTSDIPNDAVAAGIPAKVIRMRN